MQPLWWRGARKADCTRGARWATLQTIRHHAPPETGGQTDERARVRSLPFSRAHGKRPCPALTALWAQSRTFLKRSGLLFCVHPVNGRRGEAASHDRCSRSCETWIAGSGRLAWTRARLLGWDRWRPEAGSLCGTQCDGIGSKSGCVRERRVCYAPAICGVAEYGRAEISAL